MKRLGDGRNQTKRRPFACRLCPLNLSQNRSWSCSTLSSPRFCPLLYLPDYRETFNDLQRPLDMRGEVCVGAASVLRYVHISRVVRSVAENVSSFVSLLLLIFVHVCPFSDVLGLLSHPDA